MALHCGNHVRADKVAHEFGAGAGEHSAEQPKRNGDDERSEDEGDLALEDCRVFVAQKKEQRAQTRLTAGIDDMVSASQQLIHVIGIGASGRILSQDREIGCHLAVEEGHLLQFRARELFEAARAGLRQKCGEAVPVGPSLGNPLV